MSVQSTPLLPSEEVYSQLFVLRGPQVGPLCNFSITPNGMRLLLLMEHSVVVVDTRIGRIQVLLNTGPTSQLTSATWLSDTRCILGCFDGHLFQARFRPASIFGSPSVTVGYAFQDLNLPVRYLRYNRTSKLLAIGYASGVSIWRATPTTWRIVDRFAVPGEVGVPGLRTMQFVGKSDQMLFVAGGFGHAIWTGRGQVVFFTENSRVCRIGSSAVSTDSKFLVVGSLDRHVHVWSVTSDDLDASGGTYELETGVEYHTISPYIPVAITDSGLVVTGSQVGEISFVRTDGIRAFNMYFEENLPVTGLLSHGERLYVAFMGPFESVIIVAYSRSRGATRMFNRLRKAFTPAGAHSIVNIDIHQLPRTSPRNLPRKTGRTDFKMTYPRRNYDYLTLAIYIFVSFAATEVLIHLIRYREPGLMCYYAVGLRPCLRNAYHAGTRCVDYLVQLFYGYLIVRPLASIVSFLNACYARVSLAVYELIGPSSGWVEYGVTIQAWILFVLVKCMAILTNIINIIDERGAN